MSQNPAKDVLSRMHPDDRDAWARDTIQVLTDSVEQYLDSLKASGDPADVADRIDFDAVQRAIDEQG